MNPLSRFSDLFGRCFGKKWAPIALTALFFAFFVCGIAFLATPVFYEYHLRVCNRYLERVVYSDRNVVLVFFERAAGCGGTLFLILLGGVHPAALLLSTLLVAYRGYSLGGMLAVLFSVYRVSGGFLALGFYLPFHLLVDAVFLLSASLSFERAFRFCFRGSDFCELLVDFLALLAAIAAVCLIEAILLGVLFHPLGNIAKTSVIFTKPHKLRV